MAERHPVFAALYDALMRPQDWLGLRKQRRRTVAPARGCTLEIGLGTGLNLDLYEGARRVVAIEPDPEMIRRAVPRAATAPCPVDLVLARGEDLPFADGSFDTVVSTLVFCTIPDAARAVREVRRVLAPEGTFHFLEHVRPESDLGGRISDGITPGWRRLFAGCHPNRTTLATFESAGLRIESVWRRGLIVQGSAAANR